MGTIQKIPERHKPQQAVVHVVCNGMRTLLGQIKSSIPNATTHHKNQLLTTEQKTKQKRNKLDLSLNQPTMVVAQSNKPESLGRYVGLDEDGRPATTVNPESLQRVVAVKLAAQGITNTNMTSKKDGELLEMASDLFRVYREQSRLLENYLPPVDQRIQSFLNDALGSTGEEVPQLPSKTLVVDRYGLARELSFPQGAQEFHNCEVR